MVTRSIEAQRKVEARNFDIRKQLLEYDDVANDQRKTIYALRNEPLSRRTCRRISDLRAGVLADLFHVHPPEESVEEQDIAGSKRRLARCSLELPIARWLEQEPVELQPNALLERIVAKAEKPTAPKCRPAPKPRSTSTSATSCCRFSMRTGASTRRRSITCARASTCAATRRRIRSRSTSARPSSSSARWSNRSSSR